MNFYLGKRKLYICDGILYTLFFIILYYVHIIFDNFFIDDPYFITSIIGFLIALYFKVIKIKQTYENKLFLNWNDKYELDIFEIDKQHKKLFRIFNNLLVVLMYKKNKKHLNIILKELINYTKYHFITEEIYLNLLLDSKSRDYIIKHITEHKDFIVKINEYVDNNDVSIELLSFLSNWINTHVLEIDMMYKKDLHKVLKKMSYLEKLKLRFKIF